MQGTELADEVETEYKTIYNNTCTFLIKKSYDGENDT